MFVDLPNGPFRQCSDLFVGFRPDIVFVSRNKAYALELTICHKTNMLASKNYKLHKYKDLTAARSELIKNHECCVMSCELSVLGFLNMDSNILKLLGVVNCDFSFREELTKSVIYKSFNIHIRRNN